MAGLDPATQGRQLRGWMLRKPNDQWFSARFVELTLGGLRLPGHDDYFEGER